MGRDDVKTPNDLHAADVFGWPLMLAMLERIGPWAPLALRLGVLALIQECVRELAQRQSTGEHIATLRELEAALSHLPFVEHGS